MRRRRALLGNVVKVERCRAQRSPRSLLRSLRLRERAAAARAVLQRRAAESAAAAAAPKAGCSCASRGCASSAAEALLRSLRLRLRLRKRAAAARAGFGGPAAESSPRAAAAAAPRTAVWTRVRGRAVGDRSGAAGRPHSRRGARARERGRAQEGARYERERGSTSMEHLAPWGGRLVSCVDKKQCAAGGGGGDAPLSVLMVYCTWQTGLPDGAKDGNYCECKPFWRGLTCQEATPVEQLRGILQVPSALLAVLALWRALRDLRECPREKRASPGALCLMLDTCAASFYALWMSCICVMRWTGGNAAVKAILDVAEPSSLVMIFSTALFCALVFECISALAEQRTVRQKRWYALIALLVAAEIASFLKFRVFWQRFVVCAVGMLVVALLWIRAARLLANTLEDHSCGSAPLVEKARVTREFIQFLCRFLALELGCLSVLALLNIKGLNNLSPPPVIVSVCLLEAVIYTVCAAVILRFQDYLGMPLRRSRARSLKRSQVRPRSSTDRPPQNPCMLVSGARVGDARVSGAHVANISSDDTPLAQLESADSVAGQRDEVQKADGAGPRTSRARDGQPAGCVGVPSVKD